MLVRQDDTMADKKIIPLGDSHGGKQVSLIVDGETKYLWKPRPACAEKGLEAFLLLLKQEGFPFIPASEHIIEETADGFTSAFVAHLPAESADDVTLYFQRCGALIFLAYLFGSNDLHYENIIASKNTPVLIDCETLMTGKTATAAGSLKGLTDSVMKSHLLPNWLLVDGKPRLAAGLISDMPETDGLPRSSAPTDRASAVHVGGDDRSAPQKVRRNKNLLYRHNEPCYLWQYENEVLAGFTAAYRFADEHKEAVKQALHCFDGSRFRFLLRPTEVYAKFIALAQKLPEEKREPTIRFLLSAGYQNDLRENRTEQMAAILKEETDAVLNNDIPAFFIRYNGTDLFAANGARADGFLAVSPSDCVAEKLAALSTEDETAQCRILSQAIAAVRPLDRKAPRHTAAENLYDHLFSLLEEGYIASLSSGYMLLDTGADGNYYLQSAGFGLYDGLSGILCAYAALFRKTPNEHIGAALHAHYQPLRDYIHSCGSFPINARTVSLQRGISGVIASLLHIADLTGDRQYDDDAVLLAGKLQPDIADGVPSDLLCGLAGLAIQLPKLPASVSVPLAEALLPRLLTYAPTLTGAAHGAAGVALGIAAAQKVLQRRDGDAKIIELLRFEEAHFDSEHNNWRDLRATDRVAFMHGWCSGVAGEAMVRSALLNLCDNREITALCRRDIDRAAASLTSGFTAKKDCLCCGNAARLTACSHLNVKNSGIDTLLCDKIKDGRLVLLHPAGTADRNYGLMQGLAGVVYAVAMAEDDKSGGMLLC